MFYLLEEMLGIQNSKCHDTLSALQHKLGRYCPGEGNVGFKSEPLSAYKNSLRWSHTLLLNLTHVVSDMIPDCSYCADVSQAVHPRFP